MAESPGYETRDISIRLAVWVAIGTLALVAVTLAVLWLALSPRGLSPPQPAGFFGADDGHGDGPFLQSAPALELQQHRAQALRRLDSYGWVDQRQGVVHIPIERAMELYLERHGGE